MMVSFATPQRPARKPADLIAAPLAAEKTAHAAAIPAAEPLARGQNDVTAPRPLIAIPVFRPDTRAMTPPTPHPKQSSAPAMPPTADGARQADAREATPETVREMAQARIAVKQAGSPTAGAPPHAGGALPIQRKTFIGLPDALKAGIQVRPGQGRVKPTLQMKGQPINNNAGLEKAADVMGAMPGGAVIQRAYVGADAKADVALFPKEQVADEAVDLSASASAAKAATLGITSVNLKHYLNRHTFQYQPLSSASTYPPQTGMFPIGTDKDAVKSMVIEAIGLVPAGKTVSADIESITVDLANGLKVNLGALAGNKLQAFFPQGGTGFHSYTNVELQAIKTEKDALEAPAKALAAKALKDKQDAKAAAMKAKNDAFAAYKAAQATKTATPPTTPVVTI
ncbi:MAG: hypothetical protein ACYDAR_05565 [Thermomicrobiales bacterium]